MVPVPVLALYIGSVPVWVGSITGTGIPKWSPYRYWHFCTLVQYRYRYRHSPLPVMAFSCARTGIGNYVLGFSTSMGTFHYWNWHSIVPVPVLAFLHFGSVPVWAHPITGTQWWKREICRVKEWKEIHQSNRVQNQIQQKKEKRDFRVEKWKEMHCGKRV